MKVLFYFLLSSLCYSNVSAGNLLKMTSNMVCKVLNCQGNSNLNVSKIYVYFYDIRNLFIYKNDVYGCFPVDKAAKEILSIQNLKVKDKFFIYVGGFQSHIRENTTEEIKNSFRNIRKGYLIIVDHSYYTHAKNGLMKGYDRSVNHVPSIGKKLAEMLAVLKAGGVTPKNMHCIGHSLGGQILGHVGENFVKFTGHNISRITALDPAGPCFQKSNAKHIRSGDADYVEIYHCNVGVLGSKKLVGDVDFIANNGNSQPECGKPSTCSLSKAVCSHTTCVSMWMASVKPGNSYLAYKCHKYKNLIRGKLCTHKYAKTFAGFHNPGTATGIYYFSTNDGSKF